MDQLVNKISTENIQQEIDSAYGITIPRSYKIIKHYGTDYLEYNIIPIDTTKTKTPSAGIIMGDNIGQFGEYMDKKIPKDTISSVILLSKVDWIIYKRDSSYFAEAFLRHKFCASVDASNKADIINFIKIFESFKYIR